MCLNEGTNLGKVDLQVVHCVNDCAGGDGDVNLAEVLIGFAEELFGFAIIYCGFAFFGKGFGVSNKVEVAEVFLPLASELNRHN